MTGLVLAAPLAATAGFAVLAPAVARRLPPRHATWLLSAGAVLAALSTLAVLVLAASVLVGQQPDIAREGDWSPAALRAHAPVDRSLEMLAVIATVALSVTAAVVAVRLGRALLSLYRGSRDLPHTGSELVVVPAAPPAAYALPGRPGRIVVSQSLLTALEADERRAVLAHERAHLAHGHHWHLAATTLAAAVNPLLLPLRASARHAIERWADEAAADAVGDRRVVATALGRVAMLGAAGGSLSFAASAVPQRVGALLQAPPRSRPLLLLLAVLLPATAALATVVVTKRIEDAFEFARQVARAARVG
jgi:hypothetical protein